MFQKIGRIERNEEENFKYSVHYIPMESLIYGEVKSYLPK